MQEDGLKLKSHQPPWAGDTLLLDPGTACMLGLPQTEQEGVPGVPVSKAKSGRGYLKG